MGTPSEEWRAEEVTRESPQATSDTVAGDGPVVGAAWGKFFIEKRLGGGGQGDVFQAFDRMGTVGQVALKVGREALPPEQLQAWIDQEALPLRRLCHPCIVRVVDAGAVGSIPYIATELVEGLPLAEYVRTNAPSLRRIAAWMRLLAKALDEAHRRGIIHRDLKPGNIIVTPDGVPRIIDFGLASLVTAYQHEPRHDASGTVYFMAPEQARGEASADHRVDIFGLGAVLRFLLEGQGPYEPLDPGDDYAAALRQSKVRTCRTNKGPRLRRALARVANRALAVDAAQRYRTAGELARVVWRSWAGPRLVLGLGLAAAAMFFVFVLAGREPAARNPADGAVPPGTRAALPADATLEIQFQRKEQVGSYQTLTPEALPLHTGDRIQVHARFSEPLYVCILAGTRSGGVQPLFPHIETAAQPTREVHIPPGRDEWLPLIPPAGTETILLLAAREPLPAPAELSKQIAALGPMPMLEGPSILVVDERGPRLLTRQERPLAAGPVKAEKGFLSALLEQRGARWTVVRAVVFPQDPSVGAGEESGGKTP